MPTQFFGQSQENGGEAESNVIYGNDTAGDLSAKVTTGKENFLFIDICGVAAQIADSTGSSLKVRVDIARLNPITGNDNVQTITSPCVYMSDVSLVVGNLSQNPENIGARLTSAENIPMHFRTLCGDGIDAGLNRAIRVTLKHSHVFNGDKVSVYLAKLAAPTAQFKIEDADISFDRETVSARRPLVNGGPLGGDHAIIPYEAVIVRTPGSTSSGDIKIFADAPLFERGGAGIDLSAVTFMIREVGTNNEEFVTVSKPTHPPPRNADGRYEYFIKTMSAVDGNAYQIQAQGIFDKFRVFAVANQLNIGGQPLILDNKPKPVPVANISVDSSHPGLGGKAVVEFDQAKAAEGFRTIQRYTAYYVSKSQAATLSSVNTAGVDVKTAQVNVKNIKAAHPNQVAYLENADISKQYDTVKQHVTINLANSSLLHGGSVDPNTSYAVLLTASTKNNAGEFVEGDGPADMSYGSSWAATPAYSTTVSMGFVVSGAPAVPTPIRVSIGKDVSSGNLNNVLGDLSMNNAVKVDFNDFNVNMRGDKYTKVAYAVVRAQDLPYVANNFVKDASYHEFNLTYDVNDTTAESMYIKVADTSGIQFIVNDEGEWATAGAGETDLSNGSLGYIQYALKNANGVGNRTAWFPFTPSTHPAAFEAASAPNVFMLDPSGDDADAKFGEPGAPSPDGTLDQAHITSDEAAALVGLDTSNKKIKVGFSLKNKTEAAKGAAGKVDNKLSGGSTITGFRYVVKPASGAVNGDKQEVRLYGDATKDICGDSTGPVRVSNAIDKIEVTQVYDASGFYAPLKFGKRYDISFVPVNANGYNDLSALQVTGFASMGTLGAIQNVRKGSEVVRMTDTTRCAFDLSMSDICGVAQHGGHLVTAYNIKVEQNVNGLYRTLRDFGKDAAGSAAGHVLDVKADGLDWLTDAKGTANRRISLTNVGNNNNTDTSTNCLPGYPLRVTIRAEANANSAGGNAEKANVSYNKNRKSVLGAETVITLPGPLMQGDATDEVRGLNVVDGDGKLTVSFNKPEADSVSGLGEPVLDGYQIYLYDMSLTTIGALGANVNNSTNKALTRISYTVQSTDINVADPFEKEFTGLNNGKAYVVAVHTHWKYGENNNSRFTTFGKYHTFANANSSEEATEHATQDAATGLWTLPTTGIKSGNANTLAVTDCAVPRGTPLISYTLEPASLKFDNNGAPILFGAMIQMAPQGSTAASPASAEAFYLDMNSNSSGLSGSKLTVSKVGLHEVSRSVVDICATSILGEKWATEKNFVMVQNEAGSTYVKINIV